MTEPTRFERILHPHGGAPGKAAATSRRITRVLLRRRVLREGQRCDMRMRRAAKVFGE